MIERENPTWDDLADDWGKPLPKLSLAAVEMKAGSSVAAATSE